MTAPAGVPDASARNRRRQAAMAGHLGDEETARAALLDPSPAVRSTGLGALQRLGRLTPREVRDAASDPDRAVRARAAEAAVSLGPVMAEEVSALLGDPDAAVVEAACFALGELGPDLADHHAAEAALPPVALGHPDPLCREAAVAALGAIGAPWGLDAVLAAASDKPAVRRRAVIALAAYEGPEVDAALERALGDRDWQVRQAAEDLTGRG